MNGAGVKNFPPDRIRAQRGIRVPGRDIVRDDGKEQGEAETALQPDPLLRPEAGAAQGTPDTRHRSLDKSQSVFTG